MTYSYPAICGHTHASVAELRQELVDRLAKEECIVCAFEPPITTEQENSNAK